VSRPSGASGASDNPVISLRLTQQTRGNARIPHFAYRLDRSWAWNYVHGPALPRRPAKLPPGPGGRLFDLPLNSRLGIASGPLLNSKWVEAYAHLGFDILTYATVRSRERHALALPNIVPVVDHHEAAVAGAAPHGNPSMTFAISTGLPSMDPTVWRKDVRRAKERLAPGQMLMVGVVGTAVEGGDAEALALDYARCAAWAAQAGADVIAVHLADQSQDPAHGPMLHEDPRAAAHILALVRARVDRPIVATLGAFRSPRLLHETLTKLAPTVHGFSLVHGILRRVIDREGRPVFEGRDRQVATVVGADIYAAGSRQVDEALAWRKAGAWQRAILAAGGVTSVERVRASLRSEADAVLVHTAALGDPLLAFQVRRALQTAA
jgi:dihydroorotate dehydrogenase (NAD+) catalytic subunit